MVRKIGPEEDKMIQMELARRRQQEGAGRGEAGAGRAQMGEGRGQIPPHMMRNVQPGQQLTPPASMQPWSFDRSITSRPQTSGLPPTPEQIRFGAPYGSRQPFASPVPTGGGFNVPYGSRQPFGSPQPPYDPLAPSTPPYYGGPTSTSQMASSSRYGPQEQPPLPPSSMDPFDPNVSISEYIASQRPQRPVAPTGTRPQPHPHGILTVTSRRIHNHPIGEIGGSDLSQRMSELSFGASSTPPEQTGPSVRPKVRTPLQPTGSPPPPIRSEIPESELVRRYRDPQTGEPDFQRLRQPVRRLIQSEGQALDLTNLSRQQISFLVNEGANTNVRQRQYLLERGFQQREIEIPKRKPIYRFESEVPPQQYERRPRLQPRRETDLELEQDPRFNKPVSLMDRRPKPHELAPVGRQGWGPLPRRAQSMPDLRSIGEGEHQSKLAQIEAFGQRLVELKPKHRKYYQRFQREIQWNRNPDAKGRMVKPPTIGAIRDQDRERIGEIRENTREQLIPVITRKQAMQQRKDRRRRVSDESILTPALPEKIGDRKVRDWMSDLYFEPIAEEEEDEDEEEEEEEDEDEDEA